MNENLKYQDIIKIAYAGKLEKEEGGKYFLLPTFLFVKSVDVKLQPLPDIQLFIKDEGGNICVLREAQTPYSPLALSVHPTVLILCEDLPIVQNYAEKELLKMSINPSLPLLERVSTLRNASILVVEDLFNNPTPEKINKSKKIVSSFVHLLMKDPKAYLQLTQLSSHDPYTLQHSVGTAVNCVILGKKTGVKDENELTELGFAGLLHDIGKTKVKTEIINKPGPLDEEEWGEMQQHSHWGFEIIEPLKEISDLTKRAVLEHHEDKTGKGYPHGKNWSDVHNFSKIVALCDIFNAITTDRSYSKALTFFNALKLIQDKMQHKFDDQIFHSLVEIYGGKID